MCKNHIITWFPVDVESFEQRNMSCAHQVITKIYRPTKTVITSLPDTESRHEPMSQDKIPRHLQ